MVSTHLALLTLVSAAVKLPLVKVSKSDHRVAAKRDSHQAAIEGNGLSFIAEIQVGTPPQPQNVILDTGSSDLWLVTAATCNTDSSGRAPNDEAPVSCATTYDPNSSSSFTNTTNPFHITYGDLSESTGFYIQDTVGLAGTTLEQANLAYSYNTSADSIMGIGLMNGEACVRWKLQADNSIKLRNTSCTPYENVPQQLKTQGKISSSAYSIWLNDLSGPHGNILFGGVDHAKYRGQLVSLPIEAEPALYYKDGSPTPFFPKYTRTIVTLNQIDVYDGDSSVDTLMQGAIPVLLDTGSTQCSLPSALIESLAQVFGARPDGQGGYFLDCGVSDDSYIGFNFRGVEIQVPLRQFIRPLQDYYGDVLIDADSGKEYCSLGASVGDDSTFMILGDNVLSSFYSVYDLEAGVIALAPAIYNQDATDIEDIVDGIPGAVEAPAYSYSFSSHIQINPSPTIRLSASPVTSVYGQTGSVLIDQGLTDTALAGGYVAPTGAAVKPNIVRIGADANTDDTNGMTDIIGEGITQSQADGINTVYTAGPPSTLGLPTTSGNISSPAASSTAPTGSTVISTLSPSGPSSNTTTGQYSNTTTASATVSSVASSVISTLASGNPTVATVTSQTTVLTTFCPGPTTFTYGGSTYTVTSATTLTVTSCPPESSRDAQTATGKPVKPSHGPVEPKIETDTQTVTVLTTYCPEPTTLTYGGTVYTITEATTLTVTSCPPESSPSGSPSGGPTETTTKSLESEPIKSEPKSEPKTESKTDLPHSESPSQPIAKTSSNTPSPGPTTAVPTSATSATPSALSEVPQEISTSAGVVIANGASRNGFSSALLIFALF